jgi:hypothetical protein
VNAEEALVLLTKAALVDARIKPDADRAEAWAEVLRHESLDECLAALVIVQRESDAWLHPAMLVSGVRRVRDRRARDQRVLAAQTMQQRAALPQRTPEQLQLERELLEAAAEEARARRAAAAAAEEERRARVEAARAELDALRGSGAPSPA